MANLWFCVRQVVHPALDLWVCCSGVVGCLAEGLLGGVDKVEETILVLLLPEMLDVSFPSAFFKSAHLYSSEIGWETGARVVSLTRMKNACWHIIVPQLALLVVLFLVGQQWGLRPRTPCEHLSRVQLEPPPDDLDQFPDSNVVCGKVEVS